MKTNDSRSSAGRKGATCEDESFGEASRFGPYGSLPQLDPMGADSGAFIVERGGSWACGSARARSAYRGGVIPGYLAYDLGFRVVRRP
jgi:formylglycine-generating enzyme required for sulfatase activity